MSHFGKDNVDYLSKEVLLTIVTTSTVHWIGQSMGITLPFLLLVWMMIGNSYISNIVQGGRIPKQNHRNQLVYSWIAMSAYIGFFSSGGGMVLWSIPLWIVGSVVGLHFGFLDDLAVFKNFDITPSEMKKWNSEV